jgi:hypothetical protein
MNNLFTIQFSPRESAARDALDRVGEADIGIFVGALCLTELEDRIAKTVRPTWRASTYRLALWLEENWWRLCYEPEASTLDWRLSHHLPAIGAGYIWPALRLAGDGESITLRMRPSSLTPTEDIRYLVRKDLQIPLDAFVSGIDRFINAVIARLRATGHPETALEKLWNEILQERHDPDTAYWRKLEALAGLDAGVEEGAFLEPLLTQKAAIGPSGLEELTAECKGATQETLNVLTEVRVHGAISLTMAGLEPLRQQLQKDQDQRLVWNTLREGAELPWQRAYAVAARAREYWGFAPGAISNRRLAEVVGVKDETLFSATCSNKLRISAGFRGDSACQFAVALAPRMPTGRRFALARLLGDYLATPDAEHLLPATDGKTARQKFQRAFAQQLLCPVEDLKALLDTEEPSDEHIEEAAIAFAVSPLLIRSTLVNQGLLDRQALEAAPALAVAP